MQLSTLLAFVSFLPVVAVFDILEVLSCAGPEKGGKILFLFGESISLLEKISMPGLLSSKIWSEGKDWVDISPPVFPKSTIRSEKRDESGKFSCTVASWSS